MIFFSLSLSPLLLLSNFSLSPRNDLFLLFLVQTLIFFSEVCQKLPRNTCYKVPWRSPVWNVVRWGFLDWTGTDDHDGGLKGMQGETCWEIFTKISCCSMIFLFSPQWSKKRVSDIKSADKLLQSPAHISYTWRSLFLGPQNENSHFVNKVKCTMSSGLFGRMFQWTYSCTPPTQHADSLLHK